MSTLPLFEDQNPAPPLAARLAPALRGLAAAGVYIGTSSWKYEGWLGQIYSRDRYLARGKFSERKFQAECLGEYAATFPAVCGDFSFYQFPSQAFWRGLFAAAPPPFLFAFKAPEEITARRFGQHARYGSRAGAENESFLNADLMRAAFLDLLAPYREQVGVIIFEFGAFSRQSYATAAPFLDDLDRFLNALPGGFRYAVEIRNPEFLGRDYFSCLAGRGAAHVFNAWTRMPELAGQMSLPDAYTADFTVTRALLRQGRAYEQAVEKFSPYLSVQEPDPGVRRALRGQIRRAKERRERAFIFVNNRLEGNAPGTIAAVLEETD